MKSDLVNIAKTLKRLVKVLTHLEGNVTRNQENIPTVIVIVKTSANHATHSGP